MHTASLAVALLATIRRPIAETTCLWCLSPRASSGGRILAFVGVDHLFGRGRMRAGLCGRRTEPVVYCHGVAELGTPPQALVSVSTVAMVPTNLLSLFVPPPPPPQNTTHPRHLPQKRCVTLTHSSPHSPDLSPLIHTQRLF